MAKVPALIANKLLDETLERMSDGNIPNLKALELERPLSASKAPKTDCKGNPYTECLRRPYTASGRSTDLFSQGVPANIHVLI